MNVTLKVDRATLAATERDLTAAFEEAKLLAQARMAEAYQECVFANFGPTGLHRPYPWPPLSPSYAKRVGRNYATLLVSGRLMNSVLVSAEESPRAMVVEAGGGVPYAAVHQWGGGNNIPPRAYFPMHEDGEVTATVAFLCEQAAAKAFQEALR